MHSGWSDPEVVGTPAVAAMVGMDALPIRNDAPFDCGDGGNAWIADNGYQYEIIDGMTVYYGGNLCDTVNIDPLANVASPTLSGLPLLFLQLSGVVVRLF